MSEEEFDTWYRVNMLLVFQDWAETNLSDEEWMEWVKVQPYETVAFLPDAVDKRWIDFSNRMWGL